MVGYEFIAVASCLLALGILVSPRVLLFVDDDANNHNLLQEGVHRTMRRGRKIAKVAQARKLAVRLYWMMRKGWDYEQLRKFGSQGRKSGSHAGEPSASTR